jgi:RNA polymerase sigma-70 factor (ECF subfamily)
VRIACSHAIRTDRPVRSLQGLRVAWGKRTPFRSASCLSTPSGTDSLELVRRARRGEREALSALLERFRGRLLDRIRLMMGERARAYADSTDFLQETFTAVVQRIELVDVQDDRDLLRWMTWIARNAIRDSVRSDRDTRFEQLSVSLSSNKGGRSASGDTPSGQLAQVELGLRLAEALETLPREQRDVVDLHDFEGLTFREVGERLGTSEDQARWQHRRALLGLARLLGDGES